MLRPCCFKSLFTQLLSKDTFANMLQLSEYEIPLPKTLTKDYTSDQRIRVQTLFFNAY
jgi:hypothetical protein